jgi:hypothetical protein
MHPCDGVVKDLSGNGNDGTVSGPVFEYTEIGGSMKFDGVDDYVEIADDPSLDITDDLTLSCWAAPSAGTLISKWNVVGGQRSFSFGVVGSKPGLFISSAGAAAEGGQPGSKIVDDGVMHHIACVYMKADNTASIYVDGEFDAAYTFTVQTNGIFNSTANLHLGNEESGIIYDFLEGNQSTPQIFTRALSQSEITQLYNCGAQAVNFKTDYGVCESVAAESATPPGTELSNSPFRIESGSFKISTDTIGGDTCKVIECVTAGICQIPSAYFHGDDTQAAYGSFECWAKKDLDGSNLRFMFIANQPTNGAVAGFNGYEYRFQANEVFAFVKFTSGAGAALQVTANGAYPVQVWRKLELTRDSSGVFTTIIDNSNVDMTGGTGTNPVTDNTHTISKYVAIQMGDGDKIAYAAPNGDCSIVKYQGVV